MKGKRILITCGPTWVAIDPVRVFSNISTGALGQTLAKKLSSLGTRITLLEGPVVQPLKHREIRIRKFRFFSELQELLKAELLSGQFVGLLHTAAVADFQLPQKKSQKMDSTRSVRLKLVPTEKLINSIRRLAPKIFLVGFKLEPGLNRTKALRAAKELFKKAKCNLVVANSVTNKSYNAWIIRDDRILAQAHSRSQLAQKLIQQLKKNL